MSYIISIHGYSRSGKDTLASYLKGAKIKFSAPMKRAFESWYGLAPMALEDPVVRASEVPGRTGVTYLGVMIKAYHAWQDIDPLLTTRPTIRKIKRCLEQNQPVILTDLRLPVEVSEVIALAYPIATVGVFRLASTYETSDRHWKFNVKRLKEAGALYTGIDNNGSLDDLKKAAQGVETLVKDSIVNKSSFSEVLNASST